MAPPVFAAKDLTKTYASGDVEVRALRGVNFEVAAGEVVVLLGPSGSGKSTFLNIVGGIDTATSGELRFKDIDLTKLKERDLTRYRRESVGFVFQFYNLVPSLTALENVALVTEISTNPMRPQDALALIGLENRMNHFPAELSGVNSSGWRLPAPSPSVPRFCCATNPPERLIQRPASLSSRRF